MKVELKLTKDIIEILPSITLKRLNSRVRLSFAWIIFSLNISIEWK
jgi:hypothetical protein